MTTLEEIYVKMNKSKDNYMELSDFINKISGIISNDMLLIQDSCKIG